MDLKFNVEEGRVETRVSSIIYNEDKTKILVFRVIGRDFWMLPGGRKKLFENSEKAVAREINEELGLNIKFTYKLNLEVIMNIDGKMIDQTNYIYVSSCKEADVEDFSRPLDNSGQEFHWIKIEELNENILKPKELIPYIKNNDENIYHIIIDE